MTRTVPRLVAVAVMVLGLLVGCRDASRGAIAWHPCGPDDGVGAAEVPPALAARLTCGRLDVPLEPADPTFGTASLVLARLSAGGPRAGTVVVDPGGPGASGVGYLVGAATTLAAQPIAATHDIVAVDRRGVGAARPSLRCRTDAQRDAERAMDFGDRTPAGIARIEAYQQALGQYCDDVVGAALLTRAGTDYAVDDLDRIRIALGVNRIGFLGYSYGSRLGLGYAHAHPSHVAALVLDGVVDPDEDPIDATADQVAGFGRAFDAFAADCVRRADCPLGARPDGVLGRYRALVSPLIARPLPVSGRGLTAGDADTGTIAALYQQSQWPELRQALRELSRGDGSELLRLADALEGRDDDGHYRELQDAFLAITCADDTRMLPATGVPAGGGLDNGGGLDGGPAVAATRARYDALDTRERALAPFRDDNRGTGHAPVGTCETWPRPTHPPPPAPDPAAPPPVLVVAAAGDPATPYATALRVAGRLDATVVAVDAFAHTSTFRGNGCVDQVVNRFLATGHTADSGASGRPSTDPTEPSRVLTC